MSGIGAELKRRESEPGIHIDSSTSLPAELKVSSAMPECRSGKKTASSSSGSLIESIQQWRIRGEVTLCRLRDNVKLIYKERFYWSLIKSIMWFTFGLKLFYDASRHIKKL